MLMERHRISAEDAFDTLRRSSQGLNSKLRDVARELVQGGQGGEGLTARPEG
jgi:AmiR/NasT family two-component response regulator